MGSGIAIDWLLIALVGLDVVLATLTLVFPRAWFRLLHDRPYVDPQGLLKRMGAVWVAFVIVQIVALVRWRTDPYWLVAVAGVRLTESLSDWVYLFCAEHITWRGRIGLFVAPPGNMLIAWFLIEAFLAVSHR